MKTMERNAIAAARQSIARETQVDDRRAWRTKGTRQAVLNTIALYVVEAGEQPAEIETPWFWFLDTARGENLYSEWSLMAHVVRYRDRNWLATTDGYRLHMAANDDALHEGDVYAMFARKLWPVNGIRSLSNGITTCMSDGEALPYTGIKEPYLITGDSLQAVRLYRTDGIISTEFSPHGDVLADVQISYLRDINDDLDGCLCTSTGMTRPVLFDLGERLAVIMPCHTAR